MQLDLVKSESDESQSQEVQLIEPVAEAPRTIQTRQRTRNATKELLLQEIVDEALIANKSRMTPSHKKSMSAVKLERPSRNAKINARQKVKADVELLNSRSITITIDKKALTHNSTRVTRSRSVKKASVTPCAATTPANDRQERQTRSKSRK